ncbi:uncharacterized protein LOC111298616 [Durio zibethinus]|uniref:Uncharacterized protein LOC111298616 n=1 Tax=Durio zibethinus TaxID=66656 RepID=A0A6P5Z8G5_DURZI|nr:uncharacterized protein LOC111298616 [Durio zibethinus]
MKNVPRNKFLLCFRPVADMDLMLESNALVVDRSQNHQALTYVGVNKKEDMKPSATQSSVSDTKDSIRIHRPGKKTFSQVIKAVVFEIVLDRRVRRRKGIDQESYSSKHNFPLSSRDKLLDSSFDESVNKVSAGKGTVCRSNSVSSGSSCSSSSSSSSSSPNSTLKAKRQQLQNSYNTYSNHQEDEKKTKEEGTDRGSCSNNAIFLLLISLAVTIFCGKFCAILFTSIWLYFFPQQQPTGVIGNLENNKRRPEKKSRAYKKKVIMEGLLERNHNRGALNF